MNYFLIFIRLYGIGTYILKIHSDFDIIGHQMLLFLI